MCVVGNKCDLFDQREVSRDKGEEFAHQLGAMFTETSAADNIGRQLCTVVLAGVESLVFYHVNTVKGRKTLIAHGHTRRLRT